MNSVEASGERGIAIGRDAIHSIFAMGDHNQFFVGDYQRLADAYLHPWPVFERVKLDRFTGRKWIEERVDAFLRENDRGVFVLEADAGLGKTAFMAHLTQQRGYIHHFVELARGLDGVAPGLKSLAAQLLRAWVLNPNTAEAVLPGSAARPEFLQNLLKEAADQRDQRRPGEPIVLVVDALDEAGTPTGQNVLGLPRVLPRGVYLVVSHRPVDVTLSVEGPCDVETLKAEDQKNLADMRAFLEKALTWPGILKALGEGRISESQFVETLLEKSRGVWIYLHYVVAEIEAGRRSPLKLEELPRGLWQYYADYWKSWREAHGQTWDSVDLPLLTTLAAAQDSLTLDALLDLAGIDRKPDVSGRIGDLLDFEWIPYLAVSTAGPQLPCSYRFYHASLRDFFSGAIDRSNLRDAEWKRVQRFADATKQAHARISDFYIHRWGGWDANLPALQTIVPAHLDTLNPYGLRHLTAHLEAAGREDDLHRLMRLEWSGHQGEQTRARFENTWYTMHERVGDTLGYLNDVDRAWHLAERAYAGRQSSAAIGLQCRYALIVTSLGSLAGNIPPALLAALVEKGVWPGPQGLAYARQIQEPELRTRALAALAPRLAPTERDQALREAVAAARAIEYEWSRSAALAALAPHLTAPLLGEALEAARSIEYQQHRSAALAALGPRLVERGHAAEAVAAARAIGDEEYRSEALAALAPHLTAPLLGEAVAAARAIGNKWCRSAALATLAPRLVELGQPAEALAAARAIGDEEYRSRALAALAPHLTAPLLGEAVAAARAINEFVQYRSAALAALAPRLTAPLLGEALEAARAIRDEESRSAALAALAPRLAPTERDQALREAVAAARAIEYERSRSAALAALAPRLAPTERDQALREALAAARAIGDERSRSEALAALAPHLTAPLLGKAVAAARAIGHEKYRSAALAALAPRLAPTERDQALCEALEAARAIKYQESRSEALAALAPRLAPTERDQALREAVAAARAIGAKGSRSAALAALAPRLAELGHPVEAVEAARAIGDEEYRSATLAALAPRFAELPPATLSPLWSKTIRLSATRTREGLLGNLCTLVPVLAALGGTEATAETFRAIQDVRRWWP